ncbi:MAG: hypothetical protein ABJA61_02465 [Caldimonas sp.]
MPNESIELSLAPLPSLAATRDVSTSASRAAMSRVERSVLAGPGWFDSSWDLQRGLVVHEGWPGDAGLRGWIESFLGAQLSAAGGASLSAR